MGNLKLFFQEIYKIIFVIIPILVSVALIVWLDRRVWGLVQKRRSPNLLGLLDCFKQLLMLLSISLKK